MFLSMWRCFFTFSVIRLMKIFIAKLSTIILLSTITVNVFAAKVTLNKSFPVILSVVEGSYTTTQSSGYGVQDSSATLRMTLNQSLPKEMSSDVSSPDATVILPASSAMKNKTVH